MLQVPAPLLFPRQWMASLYTKLIKIPSQSGAKRGSGPPWPAALLRLAKCTRFATVLNMNHIKNGDRLIELSIFFHFSIGDLTTVKSWTKF
jgi:hypothetical protein